MKEETLWNSLTLVCILSILLGYQIWFYEGIGNEIRNDLHNELRGCKEIVKIINDSNRYRLYDIIQNKTVELNTKTLGLYNPSNGLFCVDAEQHAGRNVTDTECHEYCHYLIDKEDCRDSDGNVISCEKHFCEDW